MAFSVQGGNRRRTGGLRAKARHDEAQALHNAGKERDIEIAQNMIADGESVEKIVRYTGLMKESIEKLKV